MLKPLPSWVKFFGRNIVQKFLVALGMVACLALSACGDSIPLAPDLQAKADQIAAAKPGTIVVTTRGVYIVSRGASTDTYRRFQICGSSEASIEIRFTAKWFLEGVTDVVTLDDPRRLEFEHRCFEADHGRFSEAS